jgi:hypothetical protein
MYILDSKTSADLKKNLKKYDLTYQLVPPHVHRRNAAERAIQTYKNHLLSFLATCNPEFPVFKWDRLLFQVELTLNLLRLSRLNPSLSAHVYLNGNFDFNKTPLAPPGIKGFVHLKPDQRASFAYHGEEDWYVGPSMEHYCRVKCYLPATAQERNVDTLQFFPKAIPFPAISTEYYLKQAASDILSILQNLPSQLPYLSYGDATNNAIVQIAIALLGRAKSSPPSPSILPTMPAPVAQAPVQPPRVQPTIQPPRGPIPASVPLLLNEKKRNHFVSLLRVLRLRSSRRTHSTRQSTLPKPALQHVQAVKTFSHHVHHIYNDQGKKNHRHYLEWNKRSHMDHYTLLSNGFGRLAQGFQNTIVGTDTIDFIHRNEVPPSINVTYGNFICDYRPLKSKAYQVRLTVGGDKLPYADNAGSPAASLLETKLIINSTISDVERGAPFLLCADLKDHFLASHMKTQEFMRIKYKYFPKAIRKTVQSRSFPCPGWLYLHSNQKGMYGLKQAAILVYQHLVNQLAPQGYHPCPCTITGL